MALHNAFGEMALEGTLRRVLDRLNFARDANDRLRTLVDSGTINTVQQLTWGANNSQPGYYGTGSPNSMDMRDMYRMAMRANVMTARHQRWTIT